MPYHKNKRSAEENEFYELLADRIKMYREAQDLKRIDVAIDLNMNNSSTIAKYENGKMIPSLYRLHQIAKILDVDIIDLIPEI